MQFALPDAQQSYGAALCSPAGDITQANLNTVTVLRLELRL
jgi:hypothetical protein